MNLRQSQHSINQFKLKKKCFFRINTVSNKNFTSVVIESLIKKKKKIYIYIYIYIVIHRQTISLYHNSSVWLDM